ncbi:hypothetical protein ACWNYQ_00320 [Candidatus Vidania fulgoroideorum]
MIIKYKNKIRKLDNIKFWIFDKNTKNKIICYKGKILKKKYFNFFCNLKINIKIGKYFYIINMSTSNPIFLHYFIY